MLPRHMNEGTPIMSPTPISGQRTQVEQCHQCSMWEAIKKEEPSLTRDIGKKLPLVMLQLVSHDVGHITWLKKTEIQPKKI